VRLDYEKILINRLKGDLCKRLSREILSLTKKNEKQKDLFLSPVDVDHYSDYYDHVEVLADVQTICER
jgi:hypothetical protein